MSETDPAARGPVTRWYVDGSNLISRKSGSDQESVDIGRLPDSLKVEGYVALRSKGASHNDIMSGAKVPDRSPPSGPALKVTEDAKLRGAITHAVAEQDTKPGFVGVSREAKEAALLDAANYVATLSKGDVKDLSGRASVLAWYAKLYGERDPIRRPAPAPLADAAD